MSVVHDDRRTLDFVVTGMTCGSCAARVERVLGKQPGVAIAAVNFATETVAVTGAELDPTVLVAAVEAIGYGLTATDGAAGAGEPVESVTRSNSWLPRVLVAWPLANPQGPEHHHSHHDDRDASETGDQRDTT